MKKQLTVSFWREAYFELCQEVEQVLGKALGYPYYVADQKNFPGTVLADGVCTGDNVPESLLAEAARKLTEQKTNGVEFKSLAFDEFVNTPCTAELEVNLEKLANYFEKRARENKRRSEKLEERKNGFQNVEDILKQDRSSYYFSGKEDSYMRAAKKVRELVTHNGWLISWIVEFYCPGIRKSPWYRSDNTETKGDFSSRAEAEQAIEETLKCMGEGCRNLYRATPVRKSS